MDKPPLGLVLVALIASSVFAGAVGTAWAGFVYCALVAIVLALLHGEVRR